MNELGATELHIVGGFHPKLGLDYYERMIISIKKEFPQVCIKALTPAEIFFISKLTRNSVKEVLSRLKDSGLDALPGGGAEIFHEQTRNLIVRGKCSGEEWLDTARQAHEIGLRSNCTMLFGHVEKPEHIVDHIIRIRELHKNTNGFTTFIPLKFSLENTELEKNHMIQRESPSTYRPKSNSSLKDPTIKRTEQYLCILDSPWKEVSSSRAPIRWQRPSRDSVFRGNIQSDR